MSKPRVIVVDTRKANDYEREQIREIAEWKGSAPSTAALWLGRLAGPADALLRSVMSDDRIESALLEANRLAGQTLQDDTKATPPETLENADISADAARKWAVGYATAGGATAGATGVIGLLADIPFTITLALRAIRRIGASYGYRSTDGQEEAFAMRVLLVASANTSAEKDEALEALNHEIDEAVKTNAASRAAVAKEGAIFATRGLVSSLARNLVGRKAAQSVPIVGAAIGAAASAAFLEDVSRTARRVYQERYLRDRNVLDGPIA